jgi:hypothetical protein
LTLVLGGLLGEDMALERLSTLDSTASAYFETLGCTTLGLHFGHFCTPK